MKPPLGQTVHYRLNEEDLSKVNKGRKKEDYHYKEGDSLPGIVTETAAVGDPNPFPPVTITVFAPNGDTFAVTERLEDRENKHVPGSWQFPERAN